LIWRIDARRTADWNVRLDVSLRQEHGPCHQYRMAGRSI